MVADVQPKVTCIFCASTDSLTDEHVIPAALGGEDVVPNASCFKCNGCCSVQFEAEFNNGLKLVCYVLGVGNREAKVPSVDAVTVIDGRKFSVVLQPGGKFRLQDKKEERLLDTGERVNEYFFFSDAPYKRLQERAAKRGQRLTGIEGDGRPIEFEPESFMPLDFIGEQVALRSATKVALMAVAKVAGPRFVRLGAFDQAKRYVLEGEGSASRLFVNENFAKNMHIGPHQHMVQVYCNGAEHTVYATVTFFGGLTYLIELSKTYHGADYGFSYAYDALQRKPTPVLVNNLDTERLAIEDARFGDSQFDDVPAMAEHWREYIQAAAKERIQPMERRTPLRGPLDNQEP